jgi:hypothetical protein
LPDHTRKLFAEGSAYISILVAIDHSVYVASITSRRAGLAGRLGDLAKMALAVQRADDAPYA